MKPRALVADDDAVLRYTLRGVLEHAGLEVEEAQDGAEALEKCASEQFELVISDLRMPRVDGLTLLRRLREQRMPTTFVLITGAGSEREAVEAMKLGAYDYLKKPFENEELTAVVRRATDSARKNGEIERLSGELNLSRSLIFQSPAMSRLAILVQRLGPRDVTVLLTGESGTGKERVAEALVRASRRATKPFIRFNCAALTAELAEAELFGHSKGAFTGAQRPRAGLFREADGGTLLLDEIGELAPLAQAKLLRVLQEGEVRPVGEDRPQKVDVRVIAATHRDLRQLSAQGKFREDLFYRLNVVHLHVPPLRERPEDVPVLAKHFLAQYEQRFGIRPLRAPPELMERLSQYFWPGNVRELENAIEGVVALSVDGELDLSLLPQSGAASPGAEPVTAAGAQASLKERLDAYERGLIVAALDQAGGNRTHAARALGLNRGTLHSKLDKYGLGTGGPDDEDSTPEA
ncbi:MAG TPA: sigma-54 dependent transcriptional regulator [Myxococcales bacterium]|nr:sigma-54 dependent transcriptional regulator [Myxococcales bacterium]